MKSYKPFSGDITEKARKGMLITGIVLSLVYLFVLWFTPIIRENSYNFFALFSSDRGGPFVALLVPYFIYSIAMASIYAAFFRKEEPSVPIAFLIGTIFVSSITFMIWGFSWLFLLVFISGLIAHIIPSIPAIIIIFKAGDS